ncbi:hypothetical protein BDV27DRAFT_125242 [Aspergillus caelatus]|uniref:Uncharacterized protein n=1 Tax=Aspergillus caelatus TaxID=61420 RepID=A0A5N7A9M0_9EURO|nr:uncharacterized protein BDV27DRAFT_125242 [Aspergillus caelatus]KAE8366415.1 hypothetical protein BDV27DRAFT_125242 [Aspergillus caelatus]
MNYWQLTLKEGSGPGENDIHSLGNLSVDDLFNLRTKPGNHLVFMPNLQDGMSRDLYDRDLCNRLIKDFCLPRFFFHHMGYDANGFFGSVEVPFHTHNNRGHKGCGTFSRFLSKHLHSRSANSTEYTWHYVGLSTLWLNHSDIGRESELEHGTSPPSSSETHIMLCFDLDKTIVEGFLQAFDEADIVSSQKEPFYQLKVALGVIVERFEEDLNSFQPFVRRIEKERYEYLKVMERSVRGGPDVERFTPFERYATLYDVSRHVLHVAEMLGSATNSLASIMREHEIWTRALQAPPILPNNTASALRLYSNILLNLKLQADGFVARMENETKCASELVALFTGAASLDTLQQTLKMTRDELRGVQFELVRQKRMFEFKNDPED